MRAYAPPRRQAKMVRVVEYVIITVSPQERLSPPTVEHYRFNHNPHGLNRR